MEYRQHNSLLSLVVFLIAIIAFQATNSALAIDIAPMNWSPRSGWINVKSPGAYTQETHTPNAVGDGVADDTAAIQGVLNWVSNVSGRSAMGRHPTVYFPPGTYKISSTLYMDGTSSPCNLIGSGLNTVVKWYGPTGGAMVWPSSGSESRYVGFVWDGMGTAGCGFLEYSAQGAYMTAIRHENESFRNFTAIGTYLPADYVYPGGYPGTAIISGFANQANPNLTNPVGEVMILNCRFYNCTEGVHNPVDIFNNFMWTVDGCEFDNNGIGVDGGNGGDNFIVLNCHFQASTSDDIVQIGGFRGQRLTSSGSAQFYNGATGGTALQDCWVDGWTNSSCALQLYDGGLGSLMDCTFTNPPAGASRPIYMIGNSSTLELMLSNLNAPAFPSGVGLPPGRGLLNEDNGTGAFLTEYIPPGSLGGNITSASQTFLKSTYPADSPHILNILSYGADDFGVTNDGSSDSTAAIQAAINAAATANNGSIVYIPSGYYNISSLTVTGGNYIIEGDGNQSELFWNGGGSGAMMTVSNPQNITIRNINLTPSNSTEISLKETSSGPSNVVYDGVLDENAFSPGLVLSGLPAGAKVFIPVLDSPLTVSDCGPAQIFSMRAYMGAVNVSGATQPKTGLLGLMVAEGGLDAGRPPVAPNPSLYNFTVSDDQNLLVGPYYSEQGYNGLNLQGGAGTTPGHVSIQGLGESPSPVSVSINANNYLGRLFYFQQDFFGGYVDPSYAVSPVQVNQTGSNAISIVLAEDLFSGSEPTFTLNTSANLVATFNQYGSGTPLADEPSPLTAASLASVAQGFDDFRQLGALNLAMEYANINPTGLVAYWKLDEIASPSVDSSMSEITGTWQNSPTLSTSTPSAIPYVDSHCLTFNGTNQCVSMGNPAALPSGHAPRSICGWAKASSTSGGYLFFASFGTNTYGNGMFIGMNGTTLYGGAGQGDDLTFSNFWDNNWHFIALTYDGTTAKLYADGVLKTSAAKSDWNLLPNACYVGCQADHTQFWPGSVDDVRIYNRALSATEVSTLAGTPSSAGTFITGVIASSTSASVEGNPALTVSNNSLEAGSSGILGASDSMGDSGFNQDSTVFGAFATNLSGANITYDLGANHNVTNLLIWNFSESGSANIGAKSVTILSSTNNTTFTTVGTYTFNEVTEDPGTGSARPIPGNNPPYALGYPSCDNVPVQVLPVNIPSARYVKLVINSNWGSTGGLVGVNEINFVGK
jgi:hypothetical protein